MKRDRPPPDRHAAFHAWLGILEREIQRIASQLAVEKSLERKAFLYERLYDVMDVARRSMRLWNELERAPVKKTPYELVPVIEKAVTQTEQKEDNTKFSTIQKVVKQMVPGFESKDYFRVQKFSDLMKLAEQEGKVALMPQVAPEEAYVAPDPRQKKIFDELNGLLKHEKQRGQIVVGLKELQGRFNATLRRKRLALSESGFRNFEEVIQRARRLGYLTVFSLGDDLMVYARD